MSPNVSATLIRDARKHLKSNMRDVATIVRTGKQVPCLVVVQRRGVQLKGVVSGAVRMRKWNIIMPASAPAANPDPVWAGTSVQEGDRVSIPGHGTFLTLEITDPNTFNVATSIWGALSNATVSFSRPGVTGAATGPIEVLIQRVSDEEKSFGVLYDWEVLFDASATYPNGTGGGKLVSKGDEMEWDRSPNPFANDGTAVLDRPRYVYGASGSPVVSAYFKEPL